jgi:hypothetical protein
MIKPSEGVNVFKPSFKLDERSTSILASAVKQEFFDILQKMMEEEIRLMNIRAINADDEDEQVRLLRFVKAASMFYSGIMQHIAEITAIDAYNQSGVGNANNPEVPSYVDEFATPPTEESTI